MMFAGVHVAFSPTQTKHDRVPHARSTENYELSLVKLNDVPQAAWRDLSKRSIQPNAYYDPTWALSVHKHASGHGNILALLAWDVEAPARLIGVLPVRWAMDALGLPIPILVAWHPYASLTVPLLDGHDPEHALAALMSAAQAARAHGLLLPHMASGAAFEVVKAALSRFRVEPRILRSYDRAALDATCSADDAIRAALGPKKLKELRRQRNRLSDSGDVTVEIASTPQDVANALERFLALEMAGWKGQRGTALGQDAGDAAFIRTASAELAVDGRFEIIELKRNRNVIASGLILRHADRAFFYKLAVDETEAKTSPGVQLALDVTRRLCSDDRVAFADSSADGEHPMIDRIWRERISVSDILIPLRHRDPVVGVAHVLLKGRWAAIDRLRPIVHLIRKLRDNHS